MHRYIASLIIPCLWVSACSGENTSPETSTQKNDEPIVQSQPQQSIDRTQTIVPTSQIEPPERIIKAGIIPELGLGAWSSHILLLSETGKLYTTNTGFGAVAPLDDGPFSDVVGLSRGFEPATFLAVRSSGEVIAMIEGEDQKFTALNIETDNTERLRFCPTIPASPDSFVASLGKSYAHYGYEVTEDSFRILPPKEGATVDCPSNFEVRIYDQTEKKSFDPTSVFEDDYQEPGLSSFELGISSKGLAISQDNETIGLKIDSGLSIKGVDKPEWIYASNAALGNTFNSGVTLIRGDSNARIIMIANDYLTRKAFEGDQ